MNNAMKADNQDRILFICWSMGAINLTLTEDEALAILHATGRVKRLPRNHTRNLMAAERKLMAGLPREIVAQYRASLSRVGDQDDEER